MILDSKTALVLGGGGSRGSYELGVWQALREMDIEINIVTGTSIGAINGAMIAQNNYETAVDMWNNIETTHVFDMPIKENEPLKQKIWQTYQTFVFNFLKNGGTDTKPLKNTLNTFIDENKIRSSPIDYGLVTIEMNTNIAHELFKEDIPQGKIIDYIIASASIYPAFKPHKIDNVNYLDGAYHDNLPVKMAMKKGATNIIAVDLEAFGVVKKEILELTDNIVYIRCYWNLGPTLVFDRPTMQHNIRLGYLDTLKAYHIYDGYAFTFISGFGKHIADLFSKYLPLETLLQKGSGGFVLDQLFLKQLEKIYEEHGISEPSDADIALICAEVAGEVFGLNSEIIYSYEVWQQHLNESVAKVPLNITNSDKSDSQSNLLENLYESAKTLANRQCRAKLAGSIIANIFQTPNYQLSGASLTILPEAFLAGLYLAATELI